MEQDDEIRINEYEASHAGDDEAPRGKSQGSEGNVREI